MYNVVTLWYSNHACTHHTQLMLTLCHHMQAQGLPPFTCGEVVQGSGPGTFAFTCFSELGHSWVTAAGIKELLCVSWTFRLWGTFLLPLE